MPVQAKASLWYTICNILQRGISFIIIPVYVRVLTAAEYGKYSVFQSWKEILVIFATLNLYCGVFTKAMVDYEDDRERYTSSMQGLSTLLTSGLLLVYLVARNFWNRFFEMDTITMLLLFAYFIFYPAFTFWSVRQRVEYKYAKMVLVTLIASVITPVISIFLLLVTDLRENAVIWGFLLVQCVVGGFFYIMQFVKGKVFCIEEYWSKALKFNIPLIPHYLSLVVLGQADRIMIQNYCGSDKAGIYNLAYQVSMIMNVFVSAINNSLVPWSYEKLKTKQYKVIKEISEKLCLLVAVMTACVIIVAPEIIMILGTEEYKEAVFVIPAVAISVYFTFCYGLFSTVEFYYSATKFVMVASVIGALLNVVLNAIFIPIFGFIAAGYTTLVCYLVFMIMHYLFMRKICKREIKGEQIYDLRFVVISSGIICLCGLACVMVYDIWVIRYCIIALAVVVVALKKDKIIEIIKILK